MQSLARAGANKRIYFAETLIIDIIKICPLDAKNRKFQSMILHTLKEFVARCHEFIQHRLVIDLTSVTPSRFSLINHWLQDQTYCERYLEMVALHQSLRLFFLENIFLAPIKTSTCHPSGANL